MRYCAHCRIGTIDKDGLCLLCGAPAQPPTRAGRLAEASGTALSVLLSPAVLGTALALLLVVAVATESHFGAVTPAGVPRRGLGVLPNMQAALALSRTDPASALVHLLLPALVQALLFGLLLLILVFVWRRLRQADTAPRGKLAH
jgi:hypothetical protein